ncbi:unnamed protein product [Effrenium voratum]|nr:unnamed protein product [Effrenium voratum]
MQKSRLGEILRAFQTGHVINTMWADAGTRLCAVQMALVRVFMIWPLKAVAPMAYLYWAWRLMRSLSGTAPRKAQPQGALALLRAAVAWGLQETMSLWLGLEVFFYIYYRYKRAMLQEPAVPPRLLPGKSLDVLRRVFQATLDIQACGRLLEGPERRTPQMSPQASMQDMQEALHPKRNESNVEQLLREWDSLKKVGSQNMAPAVLLSEQERVTVESALDNAELMALKHAEISGWFFDRRTGERWLAAKVAEICRGNLAEWMAWAFFHCTPDEVPPQRREEMTKLIEEGVQWAGVDFPPGYNPHVQAMRLTMDPIPSEHRPLAYYIVTALAMPVVNGYNLEHLGFHAHRSGTLWYWLRRGRGRQGAEPPLVFCHGVGVNLLPYVHFINELLRQVPRGKDIFLVSLPHISMRIKEDVPSSTEMVACLRDMLASWEHSSAHFIGHSFGSIVVAWMARNAKEMVSVATFLDPVCFLLIKPDVCYNFMYRQPQTATQLLMHYFVARELFIAHSLSRNFFWHQNLLWPEELDMPCMVMLSGEDSIVPAHSVRRYLTGWIQKIRANKQDTFRLLWFPNLGHGEMNFGPVGLAACKRIVAEMMSLEARLSCS